MPPPPPDPPLSYTVHPSLSQEYNQPVSAWKAANPGLVLCVAVAVLHRGVKSDDGGPRILLIQRADQYLTDRWELAGGSADDHETTLYAAAARELYEETGLRAAAFVAFLGSYGWVDEGEGGRRWIKITFIADVEGTSGGGSNTNGSSGSNSGGSNNNSNGGSPAGDFPHVTLDPEEHRAFVWATEDEVAADRAGGVRLVWTSGEQKADVLRAFTVPGV